MILPRPSPPAYDLLRDLVRRTGDVTLATDLGLPRSTARGWIRAAPTVVMSLEVADLTEPELRQEILRLRRRVQKLAALLRMALALLQTSGFRLSEARLPDGEDKLRIYGAGMYSAAGGSPVPAYVAESVSGVAPTAERMCARGSVVLSSHVTAPTDARRGPGHRGHGHLARYRHVPTGTLAVLAQRLGTVSASPSTWYRLVRQYGWRRPRLRVHPAKQVGLPSQNRVGCDDRRDRRQHPTAQPFAEGGQSSSIVIR